MAPGEAELAGVVALQVAERRLHLGAEGALEVGEDRHRDRRGGRPLHRVVGAQRHRGRLRGGGRRSGRSRGRAVDQHRGGGPLLDGLGVDVARLHAALHQRLGSGQLLVDHRLHGLEGLGADQLAAIDEEGRRAAGAQAVHQVLVAAQALEVGPPRDGGLEPRLVQLELAGDPGERGGVERLEREELVVGGPEGGVATLHAGFLGQQRGRHRRGVHGERVVAEGQAHLARIGLEHPLQRRGGPPAERALEVGDLHDGHQGVGRPVQRHVLERNAVDGPGVLHLGAGQGGRRRRRGGRGLGRLGGGAGFGRRACRDGLASAGEERAEGDGEEQREVEGRPLHVRLRDGWGRGSVTRGPMGRSCRLGESRASRGGERHARPDRGWRAIGSRVIGGPGWDAPDSGRGLGRSQGVPDTES